MIELSFTAKNVLIGSTVLGVISGVTGCFAFLRRQSLLGDALAHAALPGVCLAFLVTGSKTSLPLFLGALVTGLLGAFVILKIVRFSRIKEDAAIGIVLSVFFAVGISLLTFIQKQPFGNQSGLDKFLFGQAATLLERDLWMMGAVGSVVLLAIFLLFKEFKLLAFDRDFGQSLGFPVARLELLLTLLLVVVVVVGLQTVGVVLVVASLVMPAAAARQWTENLGRMLVLAGFLGGAAGATGAMLSASVSRLPTGPTIVLISGAVLIFSLLFAPRRGLIKEVWAHRRLVARIGRENLLKDLYGLGERANDFTLKVPRGEIMGLRGLSPSKIERLAKALDRAGLANVDVHGLRMTAAGRKLGARIMRNHRLWELYLTHQLELASDHVHRDAEAMEHTLSDEAVELIFEKLGRPEVDPHGRRIPALAEIQ
jgi:manganese/zinc/iron transport system permease protein